MIEPFVRQIFYKNDVIEPKKYMTEGRPETAPLMTLAHIGGFGKCLEIFYNLISKFPEMGKYVKSDTHPKSMRIVENPDKKSNFIPDRGFPVTWHHSKNLEIRFRKLDTFLILCHLM